MFGAGDEDLSAECWGISYLFEYNFIYILSTFYSATALVISEQENMGFFFMWYVYYLFSFCVLLVVCVRIWKLARSEEDMQHNLTPQLAVLIVSVHCSSPVMEMGEILDEMHAQN